MNRDEVTEIVLSIVKDILYKLEGFESITLKTNLTDFGADSMNVLEILVCIEKRFNLNISDYDADQLRKNATVNNFVDYVMKFL